MICNNSLLPDLLSWTEIWIVMIRVVKTMRAGSLIVAIIIIKAMIIEITIETIQIVVAVVEILMHY